MGIKVEISKLFNKEGLNLWAHPESVAVEMAFVIEESDRILEEISILRFQERLNDFYWECSLPAFRFCGVCLVGGDEGCFHRVALEGLYCLFVPLVFVALSSGSIFEIASY